MLLTEDDWLRTPYPAELLAHVADTATPRKLRLFACHCCQRLRPLLTRDAVRQALATAERFADGRASADELRAASACVRHALSMAPLNTKWERALDAVLHAATPPPQALDSYTVGREAARALEDEWATPSANAPPPDLTRLHESAMQCAILRDLFPFRPAALRPDWLAWEGGQVVRLARGLYEEERFDELPVLADALEEAGCDDGRLLAHARGPGPHFKGCWLLDAAMGR